MAEYSIAIVFFIDLILGFFRAYINEKTGGYVNQPKLIAINYLKFYFWIDLLGCLPFDLLTETVSLQ